MIFDLSYLRKVDDILIGIDEGLSVRMWTDNEVKMSLDEWNATDPVMD